ITDRLIVIDERKWPGIGPVGELDHFRARYRLQPAVGWELRLRSRHVHKKQRQECQERRAYLKHDDPRMLTIASLSDHRSFFAILMQINGKVARRRQARRLEGP